MVHRLLWYARADISVLLRPPCLYLVRQDRLAKRQGCKTRHFAHRVPRENIVTILGNGSHPVLVVLGIYVHQVRSRVSLQTGLQEASVPEADTAQKVFSSHF